MLTIRLSRIGKKNKPMYRLIISEKTRDPYGRALEILGSYNPYSKELQVKEDRIKYWLSKGSGMSPTVNNLLVEKNIIKGEKVKASKAKKKKKTDKQAEKSDEKVEKKEDEQTQEVATGEKQDAPAKTEEVKNSENDKDASSPQSNEQADTTQEKKD